MAYTIEQLRIFNAGLVVLIDLNAIAENNLIPFINAFKKLSGTTCDNDRLLSKYIEKNAGSIEKVNSAGKYLGTDFNAYEQFFELARVEEYAGQYTEIRRNSKELDKFIASIDVTIDNASMVALANMKQSKIVNKVVATMKKKFRALLNEMLAGLVNDSKTLTVMGDPVAAATGTLIKTNNLITGATVNEAMLNDVITRLSSQVDADGNELAATFPKFWLCSTNNYANVVKLLKTQYAVNANNRTVLDALSSAEVVVLQSSKIANSTIHVFTTEPALSIDAETLEPQFFTKQNESDDVLIKGYWLLVASWISRNGYLRIETA